MSSHLKKAIITGASGSSGRAIALELANQCSEIVISYHNDKKGAEKTVDLLLQRQIKAACFCADFSQNGQIKYFVEEALNCLTTVDILINNAAMPSREQVFALNPEKMQEVFQVNTFAPFYLSQLCAKNMSLNKTKGVIINISSIASRMTFPRGCAYAASKAALDKLTQNLSLELSPYGIRVNAISPGVMETGMSAATRETDAERWQALLDKIPLGRAGLPEDISNLIAFLVSEKATWVTGKIFEIDGGQWS